MNTNHNILLDVTNNEMQSVAGGAAYRPEEWIPWSKLFARTGGGEASAEGGLIHETPHAK